MPKISRVGDKNSAGGAVIRGAETVFANGKRVGLHHTPFTPHRKHKKSYSDSGSPTVFAEGFPVVRTSATTDGIHPLVEGSPDVYVP
jgi:uncharacterized Zn-binding protein involved in type VI secretion